MGIEDRAPEIQEHYKWFGKHFPEMVDSVVIYSLGRGETPETVAEAEVDRVIKLQPAAVQAKLQDEQMRDYAEASINSAVRDTTANDPLYARTRILDNGTPLVTLGVPTEQSMEAILHKAPAFHSLLAAGSGQSRDMFKAYIGDQEKMHAVDGVLNMATYKDARQDEVSPLAIMKSEAVNEAAATLLLLQRQQKGEFSEPVEPFLGAMRQTQRNLLLTSINCSHALIDDSSTAAELWAKTHEQDLKNMSPREILTLSHSIADGLSYPTPAELAVFNAHCESGVGITPMSSAWEKEQWQQGGGGSISVPFREGEMLGAPEKQVPTAPRNASSFRP